MHKGRGKETRWEGWQEETGKAGGRRGGRREGEGEGNLAPRSFSNVGAYAVESVLHGSGPMSC